MWALLSTAFLRAASTAAGPRVLQSGHHRVGTAVLPLAGTRPPLAAWVRVFAALTGAFAAPVPGCGHSQAKLLSA